jgi:hypothetical protein
VLLMAGRQQRQLRQTPNFQNRVHVMLLRLMLVVDVLKVTPTPPFHISPQLMECPWMKFVMRCVLDFVLRPQEKH